MQRGRRSVLEPARQLGKRVSPPAPRPPPCARDPHAPRRHARGRGLDRTRDLIHRTRGQHERARRRGEGLEPGAACGRRHTCHARRTAREEPAQDLGLARRPCCAPQFARRTASPPSARTATPQPQHGVEPPAGDAQVVHRTGRAVRSARAVRRHRRRERTQAGGHEAFHAAGPAAFRVSWRVTLSHNSSAMSSTSRLASSVWKA